MTSGFSETQIFNAVLDRLSEESILSTTDEKAVARWLNRNYPLQRDVLLQRHPWNFATARLQLAASLTKPAFEWSFKYLLPEDCLRVMPVTADGKRNSPPIPYVVEGIYIMTNKSPPLNVRYIFRQDQSGDVHSGLYRPAGADTCGQLRLLDDRQGQLLEAALLILPASSFLEATRIDSLEGLPEEPYDDEIIMVR